MEAEIMDSAHGLGHQFRVSSSPDVRPVVFVIDDDISVLASLQCLIRCEGWQHKAFESAREFITGPRPFVPSCLILALQSPDPRDLEVQKQIARERPEIPIIVISGYGHIPTTVQAIKAGAVDFLVKPLSDDVLLSAIRQGLERSRASIAEQAAIQVLRERYASLSLRERQVMTLVVQGRLNKLIGAELNISEITVKAHRGRVMRKMDADSLPSLVHMAATLGLARPTARVRLSDLNCHHKSSQVVTTRRIGYAATAC
jgi:FixJ family two-component response regulator